MTLAKFAIPAVLTAALFAAPAFGDTADDLKDAIKKLEKATKDLGDAKDALKTDELRGKAITIDTKIDLLDKDIQEIKTDLREIKRHLEGTGTTTKSNRSTRARAGFASSTSSARKCHRVNGRSYHCCPARSDWSRCLRAFHLPGSPASARCPGT